MENQDPNPAVNLRCITARVLAATEAEDLDALEQALGERAHTLQTLQENIKLPALPKNISEKELAAALQDGDKALAALITMKQRLQAEHGRITQQTHLAQTGPAPAQLAGNAPQPGDASDLAVSIPVLGDSPTPAVRACETQLDHIYA